MHTTRTLLPTTVLFANPVPRPRAQSPTTICPRTRRPLLAIALQSQLKLHLRPLLPQRKELLAGALVALPTHGPGDPFQGALGPNVIPITVHEPSVRVPRAPRDRSAGAV
jgi:hypothetical protein